jgi:alpha-tubulin suppressor-like RCC1 family protein
LTADKGVWACGPNGGYAFWEYYYGVLGTGSEYWNLTQKTLVRVEEGDMNTPSDYLENIDAIAAGWMHSLALDVNGSIWSWGWNSEGQLGIGLSGPEAYSTTPVQVLRGDQPDDPCEPSGYLKHITAISAGRSGRHSLAIDANGYAYGWGYNKYGQCGNAESGDGARELTPVYVHQGAQADDPNDANNPLEYIVDICAGSDQSIAVEKDDAGDPNFNGCVYTWGTNWWGDEAYEWWWITEGYGLLGTGSNVDLKDTPVKVLCGEQHPDDPNQPYLNHIVAVTAGWDHCLALEKDDPYDPNIYNPTYTGRVYAWGNNGPGWGGGTAVGWERSVGGKKIFKILKFRLDMEVILCFSA